MRSRAANDPLEGHILGSHLSIFTSARAYKLAIQEVVA